MLRPGSLPHTAALLLLLAPRAASFQEVEPLPGGAPRSPLPGIEERFRVAAPDSGDWSSEDLGARASELLSELGRAFVDGAGIEDLERWIDPDARWTPLRPEHLETVGSGLYEHLAGADPAPLEEHGPRALAAALAPLAAAFDSERGYKFKVVGVELGAEHVDTRIAAALHGRRAGRVWEAHARWEVRWRVASPGVLEEPAGEGPELVLEALSVHEHFESGGTAEPLYQDVTAHLLTDAAGLHERLAAGLEHWRARLDASLGVGLLGHHGVAVGDVDGDGLEDLYLPQPGGLPNLLLRALPRGGFELIEDSGADWLDPSRGALLVDLDGDDDRDLVVGVVDEVLLCENDGRGRFVVRAAHPVPSVTGLAAADVDQDGDLDVYACGYVTPYDDEATPVPYHDANNGQPNSLLVNDGDWVFVDRTAALGLDANNRRFSFAASFEDVDGDGDQDLYVANDFGRNNLYRNDRLEDGSRRFVDVAAAAGVEDIGAGMGVTWGDVDLDGIPDLYVSNMWSSAGQRVGGQERFHGGADADERSSLLRHARGSSLFLGRGDGTYRDVSVEAGVTLGRWAWGGLFLDLDDDPWLDLCVPNGFVTGSRADDL